MSYAFSSYAIMRLVNNIVEPTSWEDEGGGRSRGGGISNSLMLVNFPVKYDA